jgi:hypothetical protein
MLGPEETLRNGGGGPNIVKDGTPAQARCHRPTVRIGCLTPGAAFSRARFGWEGGPHPLGRLWSSDQRRATGDGLQDDDDEDENGTSVLCTLREVMNLQLKQHSAVAPEVVRDAGVRPCTL